MNLWNSALNFMEQLCFHPRENEFAYLLILRNWYHASIFFMACFHFPKSLKQSKSVFFCPKRNLNWTRGGEEMDGSIKLVSEILPCSLDLSYLNITMLL